MAVCTSKRLVSVTLVRCATMLSAFFPHRAWDGNRVPTGLVVIVLYLASLYVGLGRQAGGLHDGIAGDFGVKWDEEITKMEHEMVMR